MKAKDASLLGKIVGVLVILAGAVLKWLGVFQADIKEIVLVGCACTIPFLTVDLNLIFEKVFGKGVVVTQVGPTTTALSPAPDPTR